MKYIVMILAVLLTSASLVLAGTNPDVVMMVHGNINGVETAGNVFENVPLPDNCSEFSAEAQPDSSGVEWFMLIIVSPPENSPNFDTLVFGIEEMDTGLSYIGYWGGIEPGGGFPTPLEISTDGWPNGSGEGTGISWAPACFYTYIQPVYYFGIYSYGANNIVLGPHPIHGQTIVDCSVDPSTDQIVGMPVLGIGGAAGTNPPCPDSHPEPGACCFGPQCVMLLEDDCISQAGDWYGGECGPNNEPCEQSTPTQLSTWGQIKATYQ